MLVLSSLSLVALCLVAPASAQSTRDASALAASYDLLQEFTYTFPSASTLPTFADTTPGPRSSWTRGNNATIKYMREHWLLNNNNVQFGRQDLGFVRDPAQGATTNHKTSQDENLVLAVEYPAGSYSHATGGAQFITAFPNSTSPGPSAMLLTYSVYFPADYNFVHGGKLAGLRGGDSGGCAGGEKTDGTTCFSARLMWRDDGAGEVYAYLPEKINNICKQGNVICDPTYGISLGRGQFTFQRGAWNDLALYVQLNNPPSAKNGIIQLYHNGNKVIEFNNLVLRTSSSIPSVSGQMFSTFFGGSDTSWSTPTRQFTYYRDMRMFAGVGNGSALAGTATGTAVAAVGTGMSVAGSSTNTAGQGTTTMKTTTAQPTEQGKSTSTSPATSTSAIAGTSGVQSNTQATSDGCSVTQSLGVAGSIYLTTLAALLLF
ncbi:hypothetical protein QFC22_004864 [Naganishia vaughanmartiniae]|uniref:Uncharacterized protein n=1 Tax=Naganishia vaughanmartiniae TaxID=1424756 RepID=A0ACC2WXP6_9TREE|nr:hypothetical protein QFC22_004864 [Naganishia vaughanmartiniae]